VYAGLSGAAVPATDAARKQTTAGKPFGSAMPTRSPRATPAVASASASDSIWLRSEPYVTRISVAGMAMAVCLSDVG